MIKFGSVPTEIFDGQVIVGAWVSLILTVKLQVAWLPASSEAVQVTVVVPTGKTAPEAGEQVVVTVEQVSSVVGAV